MPDFDVRAAVEVGDGENMQKKCYFFGWQAYNCIILRI